MTGNRLYKKERLCGKITIDALFLPGGNHMTVMAYPWRAVWRVVPQPALKCEPVSDSPETIVAKPSRRMRGDYPRFLISVPKKRLRHAVDRVLMRRRCREAYRLNREILSPDSRIDIAFIYVGSGTASYSDVEKSVVKILTKIALKLYPNAENTAE